MYETENEDFIPISNTLNFALVTNLTRCIIIPILDDSVLENDEVFLLNALNNTLVTVYPPSVPIEIEDDDSKSYSHNL